MDFISLPCQSQHQTHAWLFHVSDHFAGNLRTFPVTENTVQQQQQQSLFVLVHAKEKLI